jgi:hypothetical protein
MICTALGGLPHRWEIQALSGLKILLDIMGIQRGCVKGNNSGKIQRGQFTQLKF